MNRRIALIVPSAAMLAGLGALAAPASAQTVDPEPAPYTTSPTTSTPDQGVLGTIVTEDTPATTNAAPATAVNSTSTTSTSSGTGAGSLPFTGSESLLVLGLAAGALTTGVVLVGLGRRRATV